jgi:hypothetical protein
VRFTVQRLMVAVAVAAMVIGGCVGIPKRRARREWLAGFHASRAGSLMKQAEPGTTEVKDPGTNAQLRWHEAMAEKYEWATRYPFLPVWPDPPEPE